jgi:hypothetical protein
MQMLLADSFSTKVQNSPSCSEELRAVIGLEDPTALPFAKAFFVAWLLGITAYRLRHLEARHARE